MKITARALVPLAVILFAGCHASARRSSPALPSVAATELLSPSPRLIVGRVIAVDRERGFAIIELARDAPLAAVVPETELSSRTAELLETGRLQASRHVRGRTLGTTITSGNPASGDEVVWLAP